MLWKKALFIASLAVAGVCVFAGAEAGAGEPKRIQEMGITGNSAQRNADLIRRSQNRRQRDINEVNAIPRHYYDTTPRSRR